MQTSRSYSEKIHRNEAVKNSVAGMYARHEEAGRFLTAEEEVALARRWRDEGDRGALEELILRNVPLAARIAATFATRFGMAMNDCFSEAIGPYGLMTIAKKYDPEKGFRFTTYATMCLYNRFYRMQEEHYRYVGRSFQFNVGLDSEVDAIEPVDHRACADPSEGETGPASLPDEIWSCLTAREAEVIRRRFGIVGDGPQPGRDTGGKSSYDGETLEGIAKDFGCTKENIRLIERRAMVKLRRFADKNAGLFPALADYAA